MSKKLETVADVMTTKLITVTEQDLVGGLEEAMRRLRFRHLPVVDGQGQLVGLVTHRDLLRASPSPLSQGEAEQNAVIGQLPVRRVMQQEVLTVQPGDPLVQAGKLLWESKIGCLPVVDSAGRLVGIVTEADFIRIALHLLGSDIVKKDVDER